MEVLKNIILRGHIRNDDKRNTPDAAVSTLELIPNNMMLKTEPVMFYIKFIELRLLVEYFLEVNLGMFLDYSADRYILVEKLVINNEMIFKREKNELIVGEYIQDNTYFAAGVYENQKVFNSIAKENLDREELFLSNGFKTIFSPKLVDLVTNWFDNKFEVIYIADSISALKVIPEKTKQTFYSDDIMDHAAKSFGISSNAIGYYLPEDDSEPKLVSLFSDKEINNVIPAELFESYGTVRFMNIYPLILRTLNNGGTMVVDEFDASIHPMAVMSILNVFHNDEININNAQLIINTHNPIFLNSNILRRDEIKFVERDDETHLSSLYALSDFKTSGEKGVRKNEDYMNNYFVSKYGAIKDIDLSPLFEEAMKNVHGEK